jgi:DNA-binding CsgD family transcriptional regulator
MLDQEVHAMGVVDELVRARESYERGDWAAAYDVWSDVPPDSPDDLRRMAAAAQLLGRHQDCVEALQRAFQLHLDAGDLAGACRCAFWLGMVFTHVGEHALGSGWVARAQRLLEKIGGETVETAYLSLLMMYRHLAEGAFPEAIRHAEEVLDVGRRFGDPDMIAIGLASVGRLSLYAGRVPQGLGLFDEAMAAVAAGEVSPIFAGQVYCVMIEGCQDVSDLGRAASWTAALNRWCRAQPGLVAFTGQCAVHRGQIMRLHGAFTEAIEEFDAAVRRYLTQPSTAPAGLALAERGDVHRVLGDLDAAEASYERSADYGHEAQPGLALLWLARGRTATALAAIRRLLAETADPVGRSKLLPAAVEILIAGDDLTAARDAARELEATATDFGAEPLIAASAYASGRVDLADGDPAGALPYLRKAAAMWSGIPAPYDAARARLQIGCCLRALGDEESATAQLSTARRTFRELGAAPAAAEASRLLAPPSLPDGLTAREVEVLRLVATGRSNTQIAADLVLSEKTVARHLSNIFAKVGVTSRTAAAAYAFEHGLA